jgi:glycosyltransferase involved in cell wall biosynthesis
MRRLLLAFEPPDGGVAENVAQLALGLRRHGWEPVVAGPPEASVYGRLEAAGVELHRLPLSRGLAGPVGEARALRELRRLIGTGGFEVVHSHSSKAGALARAAAPRRLPSVYTPHCFAFVGEVGRAQRWISTAVESALGRRTDAILCVCEWERRLAEERHIAPAERLHRIYNGVEPCPPGAGVDPRLEQLRGEGPVVGAIAVMRRQKRLDLLIEAAPAILAANPEARVAIVGNGPERRTLEALAADRGLDRDDRFQMIPFEGSSARYLSQLEVFALPSEWEALPISVLEALACGVPQVATDVGGTGEAVVPETGILVPPRRPELLADAVTELLRDPRRREAMAEASRARHRERFTIERMVAETAAVYDSLTGYREQARRARP